MAGFVMGKLMLTSLVLCVALLAIHVAQTHGAMTMRQKISDVAPLPNSVAHGKFYMISDVKLPMWKEIHTCRILTPAPLFYSPELAGAPLVTIPVGSMIRVTGEQGPWLAVSVRMGENLLSGYVEKKKTNWSGN